MLLNKKGQLGPGALEEFPISIMSFISAIVVVMLFFNVMSTHASGFGNSDLHNVGKRAMDSLSHRVFGSDFSLSFSPNTLDANVVKELDKSDQNLSNHLNFIEYSFRVEISYSSKSFAFGKKTPADTFTYARHVTVLDGDSLYNGKLTLKIWPK
jgi:hypothetical protein